MKYILADTRIVHWDEEGLSKINPDSDQIMQGLVTAEMFVINNNRLPIIIEGQIRILDHDEQIFSCIFHTKALLTFDMNKNPILDLISMFDEAFIQEQQEWKVKTIGTVLEGSGIADTARDSETRFNKAYQVMEHARKRHLLAEL
jgi:hypothetical protein